MKMDLFLATPMGQNFLLDILVKISFAGIWVRNSLLRCEPCSGEGGADQRGGYCVCACNIANKNVLSSFVFAFVFVLIRCRPPKLRKWYVDTYPYEI